MNKTNLICMLTVAMLFIGLNIASVSAFSISVAVSEKYQTVYAGERIYFEVEVENLNGVGRDFNLKHEIKRNGEIVVFAKEVKFIESRASFVKSITIPENTEPGIYLVVVTVNEAYSASASFYVELKVPNLMQNLSPFILIFVLFMGFIIWREIRSMKKQIKGYSKRSRKRK